MLYSRFNCKLILNISQTMLKGLRDPTCGCISELFSFIKAVGDECGPVGEVAEAWSILT